MKIASITITPKKGESVTLRFLVVQSIPYPDIASNGGRLEWRNDGGLFPRYYNPASGIGENYHCYCLADGITPPEDYNRTHFAGYDGKPGAFLLRGKDIGELTINLGSYAEIKVQGFNTPTPGEREFITAQIVEPLRAFIAVNKAALKEEAVVKITAQMRERVATARKEIDRLEAMINTAKF